MDNILVFGKDQAEHDGRLFKVLMRINKTGGTLNCVKCEVSKSSVKFFGHILDKNGIGADPDKTQAL